ncbi:MAG: CotH kinase family protein [Kiritimatiellae bacterium]|nr:CotH kinase family protein [Kiritimatiellia bacterium]
MMSRSAIASVAIAVAASAGGGLVVVSFDPAGGTLDDNVRVVSEGGTYGENANLYPSGSPANFSDLPSNKITLADGVFAYSTSDRWCNYWSRPIANIVAGRPYTYVIDVLSYANESSAGPWFNIGHTGNDQPAQLSWASAQVTGAGRHVRNLTGRTVESYTTLGRDYVDFNHSDGGVCSMTFRVQLYAGKDAVPADGAYAASGECVAMPLPVPARPGFTFAGWRNAAGEAVTSATVVPAGERHTLTAAWRRNPGTVVPVKVTFDANGGQVKEKFRIVNTEQPFGRTVNLYPGTARDKFMDFNATYLALQDNVFTYNADGRWCNYWARATKSVEPGETYTYVIDVASFAKTDANPWFNLGQTGDWQAQLSRAAVEISAPGVYAVALTARDAAEGPFDLLGRDYIELPGGSCQMTFRIALFPGTSVNAANYSYAAPGEGMSLALPVATKSGRAFDCWVDAAGNRITDETVADVDGDVTLTAQWKPWTITVENADRPQVGKTLTASTDYGDGSREGESGVVSYKWFRGDWKGDYEAAAISTAASYTPVAGDLEHFLKAVVYVDGSEILSSALWLSKLPVVYIDTSDGADIIVKSDEKTSNVRVQGNAEFKQQYDGLAFVKGRGNSTWGLPKKPYKVKLDSKTDMFGFGKQKHCVLLANYIDASSMRNKTAYDMSGAFGLVHQDSTWVEVVFNGRFDGLYQFCEHVRVDKTRVNIHNWEDDVENEEDLSSIDPAAADISGGYLWELSAEYDEISKFKIDVTGDGETNDDIPVMFNRPEFAYTNPAMMEWCSNFWQEVYFAWTSPLNQSADGSRSWEELCDIGSMVSYWLVNEIFGNDDAWYKSRYCYKDIGGKLTFGPVWDCDWGLGSVATGTNNVSRWRLARENNSGWPVSFYKEWLDDPWFCLKALEKYWAMRPKFDSLLADGSGYDTSVAYLHEAGLAEDARWGAARESSYGVDARTQAGDAATFKWWMKTRLAWLDTQFADLDTFVENVRNDASASPFVRTPGALSANGSADRELTVSRARPSDFNVAVGDTGATAVDVILNGRLSGRGLAVTNGMCAFRAKAFDSKAAPGTRALVAVLGRRADGEIVLRDYMTLRADASGLGIMLR